MKTTRAKFIPVSLLLLTIALSPTLTGCSWAKGPGQDEMIRILARRIAFHGVKKWPDHFATLGRICQSACEISQDREKAIQGAFENITRVILKDVNDPLLRADMDSLIQLTGIKQDLHFKVLDITPDQGRVLEVIVCSFAEGTRLKSK